MLPLLSVTSAPATEPLTLTEAKLFLRVTHSSEDALITGLITAARIHCETRTRRAFITQTVTQSFAELFADGAPMLLARAPVASISSVTYVDSDGTTQTLSSDAYRLITTSGPTAGRATLEATDDYSAPTLDGTRAYPVTVTTVCGYGSASSVPAGIKSAMYLLIGDLYEQRAETVAGSVQGTRFTVDRLLAPYCLPEVA